MAVPSICRPLDLPVNGYPHRKARRWAFPGLRGSFSEVLGELADFFQPLDAPSGGRYIGVTSAPVAGGLRVFRLMNSKKAVCHSRDFVARAASITTTSFVAYGLRNL